MLRATTLHRRQAALAASTALALVLGAGVVATGDPARAAFGGDARNGRIVFRSSRSGLPALFLAKPSGKGIAVRLTDGPDARPAWSPDGRTIAFTRTDGSPSRRRIWLIDRDGSNLRRLTNAVNTEMDPAWSPDGTKIVFSSRSSKDDPMSLWIADLSTGERYQLTLGEYGATERAPAWSPDGSQIAYVSDHGGGLPEIYLVPAGGGEPIRLTVNDQVDANPSWSPDGTRIAIERCCGSGSSDIWVIRVDGSKERNVTASEASDFDPAFSPDGRKLVYASAGRDGNLDIWILTLDGSLPPVRITEAPGPDLSPEWQPLPRAS